MVTVWAKLISAGSNLHVSVDYLSHVDTVYVSNNDYIMITNRLHIDNVCVLNITKWTLEILWKFVMFSLLKTKPAVTFKLRIFVITNKFSK